jgi:hypothetical protein
VLGRRVYDLLGFGGRSVSVESKAVGRCFCASLEILGLHSRLLLTLVGVVLVSAQDDPCPNELLRMSWCLQQMKGDLENRWEKGDRRSGAVVCVGSTMS